MHIVSLYVPAYKTGRNRHLGATTQMCELCIQWNKMEVSAFVVNR
jgi:hypothetical protein